MSKYELYRMSKNEREKQIAWHEFYVEQANKRLLSQFADMKEEADRVGEKWLKQNQNRYNPFLDNTAKLMEEGEEVIGEFFQSLKRLRDDVRLSIIANIYYNWDKQFRNWTANQMSLGPYQYESKAIHKECWGASINTIIKRFKTLNWDIGNKPYFDALSACRLVVNVYKHGDGQSFNDLKEKHPAYIDQNNLWPGEKLGGDMDFTTFENLSVSNEHVQIFSDAITQFWKDVPERIFESDS